MTSGYLPSTVGGGDLVAELASIAPQAGPNTGLWPGLTIYRFTAPAGPTWEEIQSLSLCVVTQGRKAVTVGGETYMYDPFRYLVLSSHLQFQAEILEATAPDSSRSAASTTSASTGNGYRPGGPPTSPTAAANSCAPSASPSDQDLRVARPR